MKWTKEQQFQAAKKIDYQRDALAQAIDLQCEVTALREALEDLLLACAVYRRHA